MKSIEDLESALVELGLPYHEIESGQWVVTDESESYKALVTHSGPVIDIRFQITALPKANNETLLRTLLELNATELLYGAYGIDAEQVVLVEVLSTEHTDLAILREAFDALFMTVATQSGIIERALEKARSQEA